jgi:hypothetical protein
MKKNELTQQVESMPTEYGQLLSGIKARVHAAQLAAFHAANKELVAV